MCVCGSIVQGYSLFPQGLAFLKVADSAGPVSSDTTVMAFCHRLMSQ